MKQWIGILLACALALSGCTDTGEDSGTQPSETSTTTTSTTTTSTGSTTTTTTGTTGPSEPSEPTNSAPVGTLAIAALAPAGEQSNFTINVTDADGDDLSWTFDGDGDGEVDLEGTANATAVLFFETAGDYTATLNVTDGTDSHEVTLSFTIEAPVETTPAVEDRGWYLFDPATSLCNVKDFTAYGTGPATIYTSSLGGGTWVLGENNGIPGLQIADDHPTSGSGAGFEVAGAEDCVDGDLILI